MFILHGLSVAVLQQLTQGRCNHHVLCHHFFSFCCRSLSRLPASPDSPTTQNGPTQPKAALTLEATKVICFLFRGANPALSPFTSFKHVWCFIFQELWTAESTEKFGLAGQPVEQRCRYVQSWDATCLGLRLFCISETLKYF